MSESFIYKFLYNSYIAFFESKFLNKWFVLLIDLFLILFSVVISYSIVQQVYQSLNVNFPDFRWLLFVSLSTFLTYFLLFRTYQGIIRYSTIYEMQLILFCLVVSHVTIFGIVYFAIGGVSGSVLLAYTIIALTTSLFSILGIRLFIVFGYRRYLAITHSCSNMIPIYVYGTSPQSVSLKEALHVSQTRYKVAGFLSVEKNGNSKRIESTPIIYVERKNLNELKKYTVKTILFPDEEILMQEKDLVEKLLNEGIKSFVLPKIRDVQEELHKQIRPVQIEDLLGRKEIKISTGIIEDNIKGKTVLVTGAAGSIGSEIVRQLANFGPQLVVCLDIAETPLNDLDIELKEKYKKLNFVSVIGDVRNQERLNMVFSRHKPDIVYHAAAYKHVPMMENNPCEAIMTNVYGTSLVADFAIKNNVEMFVMVSTDKAVNPTNIMGASKRIAEIYVQSLAMRKDLRQNIKFVTTRFGNVLGSNGSVIPLFKKQIDAGGPLTVTDPEITRYFMTIPEACRLVLEASAIGHTGYIYVFDMGKPVKILDLATKMIELAGLRPGIDIKIEFSGLRPGEKLYEELLNDSEQVIPTDHEKILIAKVREYEYFEIIDLIDELVLNSRRVDIKQTVKLMKELVPEFISKNSKFCEFDKVLED
ncbi:nucleoside-diphosphate sugar epimerase/dehydratase [Dysgonomonas sp. 520]|uniref:polysaccharide biosynthesis protein n=1 Tax=Dysgonomonas sp. 520 TaxID=2302931 RepID=UPI0013D2DA24|nr:nucleoside-diphosphate sugar epimerase/dehydratase [Dysgonomonas sp. 520]NDW10106.1 polysaccharide biosynthesis protein [Dysgonomonas sp. 520]